MGTGTTMMATMATTRTRKRSLLEAVSAGVFWPSIDLDFTLLTILFCRAAGSQSKVHLPEDVCPEEMSYATC